MNGWQIALVVWFAFIGLINVARIGKPVTPTEPHIAVCILLVNAAWIYVAVRA